MMARAHVDAFLYDLSEVCAKHKAALGVGGIGCFVLDYVPDDNGGFVTEYYRDLRADAVGATCTKAAGGKIRLQRPRPAVSSTTAP